MFGEGFGEITRLVPVCNNTEFDSVFGLSPQLLERSASDTVRLLTEHQAAINVRFLALVPKHKCVHPQAPVVVVMKSAPPVPVPRSAPALSEFFK